jgi:hypothetical protein
LWLLVVLWPSLAARASSDPWWNKDWPYRVKITVDHTKVAGNLTNFPVYIDLGNLPSGFWENLGGNGYDIRVTNAAGDELPREIVSVTDSGSSGTGELHFKADFLSGTLNTVFYIYVGNSSIGSDYPVTDANGRNAVWSDGYVLVSHDGGLKDSTSHGNHGTQKGGLTTAGEAGGQIGKATNFNGSSNYISTPPLSPMLNNFSLSVWALPEATHQIDVQANSGGAVGISGQKYLLGPSNGINNAYAGISLGTNGISVYEHGGSYMPPLLVHSAALTVRSFFTINYINKQPKLYINGSFIKTGLTSLRPSVLGFQGTIGGMSYGYFDGTIDELRISSKAKTDEEIQTEYQNQKNPSNFIKRGAFEGPKPSKAVFYGGF